jgi:hypothetical protein
MAANSPPKAPAQAVDHEAVLTADRRQAPEASLRLQLVVVLRLQQGLPQTPHERSHTASRFLRWIACVLPEPATREPGPSQPRTHQSQQCRSPPSDGDARPKQHPQHHQNYHILNPHPQEAGHGARHGHAQLSGSQPRETQFTGAHGQQIDRRVVHQDDTQRIGSQAQPAMGCLPVSIQIEYDLQARSPQRITDQQAAQCQHPGAPGRPRQRLNDLLDRRAAKQPGQQAQPHTPCQRLSGEAVARRGCCRGKGRLIRHRLSGRIQGNLRLSRILRLRGVAPP